MSPTVDDVCPWPVLMTHCIVMEAHVSKQCARNHYVIVRRLRLGPVTSWIISIIRSRPLSSAMWWSSLTERPRQNPVHAWRDCSASYTAACTGLWCCQSSVSMFCQSSAGCTTSQTHRIQRWSFSITGRWWSGTLCLWPSLIWHVTLTHLGSYWRLVFVVDFGSCYTIKMPPYHSWSSISSHGNKNVEQSTAGTDVITNFVNG